MLIKVTFGIKFKSFVVIEVIGQPLFFNEKVWTFHVLIMHNNELDHYR